MRPCFNTAGPCVPGEHYMLPPGDRVTRALRLVSDGKFFSLVAGHPSGKTTCLRWMVSHYNAGDSFRAVWVDLETARDTPEPATAFRVILDMLLTATARTLPDLHPALDVDAWMTTPGTALLHAMRSLSACSARPLVYLFDEADGLAGATMVSFLSQLRAGYLDRSTTPFARSVVLVGRRAVRDYALSSDERSGLGWSASTSPFNVNAEVSTLDLFSAEEVGSLLAQHTAQTGQAFEREANARVFELSQGQPWLVNALADYAVDRLVEDRARPVTATHVDAAKDAMIIERRTHIDALVARLREPRVRRILDAMIAGAPMPADVLDDDLSYARGLGLVRIVEGEIVIANPIYREVFPRALTYVQQVGLYQKTAWYLQSDGLLDVPKLMAAWQLFWREDGHVAAEGFSYRESGPHLMLMAFLQRVINGGGRIEREYALGKDALDLLVVWKTQRIALEIKLWRRPTTEAKGLRQLGGYLDSLGLREGWLLIFETRPGVDWDARVFTRTETVDGATIHVIGC